MAKANAVVVDTPAARMRNRAGLKPRQGDSAVLLAYSNHAVHWRGHARPILSRLAASEAV